MLTNDEYLSIIFLLHFFRGDMVVVDISKISKLYGASIDVDYSEEIKDLDFSGQMINFNGPVNVSGKITNLKEILLFEGKIDGKITLECDRCTKSIDYKFNIDANEKFSNNYIDNEDDLYIFRGDTIDLGDVVKNIIVLNLPMKYICSEGCKGLCPNCGTDLNTTQCGCNNEIIDPRLEGLKKFLK